MSRAHYTHRHRQTHTLIHTHTPEIPAGGRRRRHKMHANYIGKTCQLNRFKCKQTIISLRRGTVPRPRPLITYNRRRSNPIATHTHTRTRARTHNNYHFAPEPIERHTCHTWAPRARHTANQFIIRLNIRCRLNHVLRTFWPDHKR